jgi:hypothetical protein
MTQTETFVDELDDCPDCPRLAKPSYVMKEAWPNGLSSTLQGVTAVLYPTYEVGYHLEVAVDMSATPMEPTEPEVRLEFHGTVPCPSYFPAGVNRALWTLYVGLGEHLAHYMDRHGMDPDEVRGLPGADRGAAA